LILSKPEKFDVETIEPSDITASSLRHDTRTVNLALVQCECHTEKYTVIAIFKSVNWN